MFRHATRKLGQFLVSLSSEGAPDQASGLASNPQADPAFERRAADIARSRDGDRPSVLAGAVQLLGLEQIREEFGDRWQLVADRAFAVADVAIATHLSGGDVFSRQGDTYVICFAELDQAAARVRVQEIASAIRDKLATSVHHRIGVAQCVAEVDLSEDMGAGGSITGALMQSLRTIRQETEEAYQRHKAALLRDSEVHYRPIWRPSDQMVTKYRSVVDERTGRTSLDYLRSLSSTDEIQQAMADLDCVIFCRTAKELHGLVQANAKCEFVIPVHFNTFNTRHLREEYLKLCHELPEAYRSFIWLELYGAPPGTPSSRLAELAQLARGVSRAAVFDLEITSRRVMELQGSGVFGVSADVRQFQANPAALSPRFGKALRQAQEIGLVTLAHGADTLGLLHEAVRAGFSLVSGHGVSPVTDRPKAEHRLPIGAAGPDRPRAVASGRG